MFWDKKEETFSSTGYLQGERFKMGVKRENFCGQFTFRSPKILLNSFQPLNLLVFKIWRSDLFRSWWEKGIFIKHKVDKVRKLIHSRLRGWSITTINGAISLPEERKGRLIGRRHFAALRSAISWRASRRALSWDASEERASQRQPVRCASPPAYSLLPRFSSPFASSSVKFLPACAGQILSP